MSDASEKPLSETALEAAVRTTWAGQQQPAPQGEALAQSVRILRETMRAGAAIPRTTDKTRMPMVGVRRDIE